MNFFSFCFKGKEKKKEVSYTNIDIIKKELFENFNRVLNKHDEHQALILFKGLEK